MTEVTAARTLVKSPPELWAECSDAASLGRHLDQFGEIRITRLEPETAVAWEGEHACGTVRLEPSGWGTRVLLSARLAPPVASDAESEPEASTPEATVSPESEPEAHVPEPEAPAAPATDPPPRGLLARLRARFRRRPAPPMIPAAPISAPAAEPPTAQPPVPEPPVSDPPMPDPPAPHLAPPDPPAPEPLAVEAQADQHGVIDPAVGLAAALDSLGQAHHRPYSRA